MKLKVVATVVAVVSFISLFVAFKTKNYKTSEVAVQSVGTNPNRLPANE